MILVKLVHRERQMERSEQFQRGDAIRRQVMGDAYVDRSWENADETKQFTYQNATELAWANFWTRPGLDLKTRSVVTLAVLAALGRTQEIRGHVRGGLNNGLTPDEIRELFLHVACYAGFPAAIEALRVAGDVFQERG
jgi:4-carboxymuconolactone decarboxylase